MFNSNRGHRPKGQVDISNPPKGGNGVVGSDVELQARINNLIFAALEDLSYQFEGDTYSLSAHLEDLRLLLKL